MQLLRRVLGTPPGRLLRGLHLEAVGGLIYIYIYIYIYIHIITLYNILYCNSI